MIRRANDINWHRRRLLDQLVEAYVDWREECSAVWIAYSGWSGAPPSDAADLYTIYSAALNREQRTSEHYARLILRMGASMRRDHSSIAGLTAGRGAR